MDLHAFWLWLITDDDAPAWIQAFGSIAGIAIAILVPLILELSKRADERRDKAERRLAAYRAMEALIDEIEHKAGNARLSEIDGAAEVLSGLDLNIFTPEALTSLVKLRARIASASALVVTNQSGPFGAMKPFEFDVLAARQDLRACAKSMGAEQGDHQATPGGVLSARAAAAR